MGTTLRLCLCVAIVVGGAWAGYRTGAIAQLFRLAVIAACYLIATVPALGGWTIPQWRAVPQLLQPFVMGAVLASALYLILTLVVRRWLLRLDRTVVERARDAGIEAPEGRTLSSLPLNRRWGLVLGGIKGTAAAAALFLGVHFISMMTVAMTPAPPPPPRTPGERAPTLPPPPPPSTPVRQVFLALGKELKHSPIAPVAEAVSPVKPRQYEVVSRLTRLAEDPEQLRRFRAHPAVSRLMTNPRLRDLAEDAGVRSALEDQRWVDLMDHPAILALVRDARFREELAGINLEEVVGGLEPRPSD